MKKATERIRKIIVNAVRKGKSLSYADLSYADLSGADLRGADLRSADLRGADLRSADLRGANLSGAKWDYLTIGIHGAPEGELIGYKKLANGIICKLRIPESAPRSWATTRKLRCQRAVVLEGEGTSGYDSSFVYNVGETVEVTDFDTNRWNECSRGIHFFLTREEAEEWDG
jgi:hypothetical protein